MTRRRRGSPLDFLGGALRREPGILSRIGDPLLDPALRRLGRPGDMGSRFGESMIDAAVAAEREARRAARRVRRINGSPLDFGAADRRALQGNDPFDRQGALDPGAFRDRDLGREDDDPKGAGIEVDPAYISVRADTERARRNGERYRNEARRLLGQAEAMSGAGVYTQGLERTYIDGTRIAVRRAGGVLRAVIHATETPDAVRDMPLPEPEHEHRFDRDERYQQVEPFLFVGVNDPEWVTGDAAAYLLVTEFIWPGELFPLLHVWEPGAPQYTTALGEEGEPLPFGDPAQTRDHLRALEAQESGGIVGSFTGNSRGLPRRRVDIGRGFYGAADKLQGCYIACASLGDTQWSENGAYLRGAHATKAYADAIGDLVDPPAGPFIATGTGLHRGVAPDGRFADSGGDPSDLYYWHGAETIDPVSGERYQQVFVCDPYEGIKHALNFESRFAAPKLAVPWFNPYSARAPREYVSWGPLEYGVPGYWREDYDFWLAPYRRATPLDGMYRFALWHGYVDRQPFLQRPYGRIKVVSGQGPGQTVAFFDSVPGRVYGPVIEADCYGNVRVSDDQSTPLLPHQ